MANTNLLVHLLGGSSLLWLLGGLLIYAFRPFMYYRQYKADALDLPVLLN